MNRIFSVLGEASLTDAFFPVVGVLLVIALLIGAVAVIRKYITAGNDEALPESGFTLGSLRQLVRDGKMTQEEFDKAKSQIVEATQRATERKVPAVPAPEPKIDPDDPI